MGLIVRAVSLACSAALAGISTPGYAQPNYSYSTFERDYSSDFCREQAPGAFQSGGWTNVHASGQPSLSFAGDKGELAGLVICLSRSWTQSVVVIFVTGGEGDAATNARDQLAAYMKRWS